jgi:hypothetical protein
MLTPAFEAQRKLQYCCPGRSLWPQVGQVDLDAIKTPPKRTSEALDGGYGVWL